MANGRDSKGRFLSGGKGGPGRPKGSRVKLEEIFLAALVEDFQQHGEQAIRDGRAKDPIAYVRVIAHVLPKELQSRCGRWLRRTSATTSLQASSGSGCGS